MINTNIELYYSIIDKMRISCIIKKKYHTDIVNFIKKSLEKIEETDYINSLEEIAESASWYIRNKIKTEHRKQKKV